MLPAGEFEKKYGFLAFLACKQLTFTVVEVRRWIRGGGLAGFRNGGVLILFAEPVDPDDFWGRGKRRKKARTKSIAPRPRLV